MILGVNKAINIVTNLATLKDSCIYNIYTLLFRPYGLVCNNYPPG
jgi:hypothetical protein